MARITRCDVEPTGFSDGNRLNDGVRTAQDDLWAVLVVR